MLRLDSLSDAEFSLLYKRSAYLSSLGTMFFLFAIVYIIAMLYYSPWLAILAIPQLALVYVFKNVRNNAAKIFFYILSISGIISSIVNIIILASSEAFTYSKIIYSVIVIFVCFKVLQSARTNLLFNQNPYTHKQLVFVKKKKEQKISFTDEEIPVKHSNPIFLKICIIISYIAIANITIGICLHSVPRQKTADDYILLGNSALVNKKHKEAFEYYKKAAETGSSEGQVALGHCYLRATGTEKNISSAIKYFEMAAKQNNPRAQYALGMLYYYGNGQKQNFLIAAELLEKSADQGYRNAQEMLSYKNGKKPDTNHFTFSQYLSMKYKQEVQQQ